MKGDLRSGHFSILPNLADFGHFLPKMSQNHDNLAFSPKTWQFSKILGTFGTVDWLLFEFTSPIRKSIPLDSPLGKLWFFTTNDHRKPSSPPPTTPSTLNYFYVRAMKLMVLIRLVGFTIFSYENTE